MPIDSGAALGATIAPFTTSWDADDVILYHLGIGAGLNRPTAMSRRSSGTRSASPAWCSQARPW